MMRVFSGIIMLVVLSGIAYVRLAPSDPARWHLPVSAAGNADTDGSAVRVVQGGPDLLSRGDAYMRALARTQILAGSVESGRVTYITRSRLFGFPDYTTIEYDEGVLKAYGRLRFGQSDMGVNSKRLEGLVTALQ